MKERRRLAAKWGQNCYRFDTCIQHRESRAERGRERERVGLSEKRRKKKGKKERKKERKEERDVFGPAGITFFLPKTANTPISIHPSPKTKPKEEEEEEAGHSFDSTRNGSEEREKSLVPSFSLPRSLSLWPSTRQSLLRANHIIDGGINRMELQMTQMKFQP